MWFKNSDKLPKMNEDGSFSAFGKSDKNGG